MGGNNSHTQEEKRKAVWNEEVTIGFIKMLTDSNLYGTVVFTFVNGSIVSSDVQQHIKHPQVESVVVLQPRQATQG